MNPGVGADIESLCSKCGDVWHVVVAKVGDDIVKVQCKECGGYHRHRRSGVTTSTTRKPRAAGSATPRRTMPRPAPVATFTPDPSAPVRAYSMRESFQPGEQISHPRFGLGMVEKSTEPGKMSVVFTDGVRVLAQAKPESRLESHADLAALADDRPEEA